MLDKFADQIGFQGSALALRAERQRTIASNIANADTPGYAARDFNFSDALRQAGAGGQASLSMAASTGTTPHRAAGFLPITAQTAVETGSGRALGYVAQSQPSMDGNSVDLDRERAAFADNAVRYEATLRFINGQAKTLLTAIQGQ